MPAASASADGRNSSRRPPATVWWLTDEINTVELQEVPPLVDRKERIVLDSDS